MLRFLYLLDLYFPKPKSSEKQKVTTYLQYTNIHLAVNSENLTRKTEATKNPQSFNYQYFKKM